MWNWVDSAGYWACICTTWERVVKRGGQGMAVAVRWPWHLAGHMAVSSAGTFGGLLLFQVRTNGVGFVLLTLLSQAVLAQ